MTKFTVTFEYPCGAEEIIETDNLLFKGIQLDGYRPCYITIRCNVVENDYLLTTTPITTRTMLYSLADNHYLLDTDTQYYGRLILKPYWFHKLYST